jgi:ribosome-associated heat shock protein Hsp15
MATDLQKVRIDKWLWAVRIFKSRTQATDACQAGRVSLNGHNAKPSANVQRGQTIQVKKEGFNLIYKVIDLLQKRASAEIAAPCYQNITPADEMNKFKDWFVSNATGEFRERGAGRPTKRERRDIDTFKDDDLHDEYGEDEYPLS